MSTDKRRFALHELLKIIQILERMAKNKGTTISALVEELLRKLDEDTSLRESRSVENIDARALAIFRKLGEMPQVGDYFTTSQVADSLKISTRSAVRYMNHLVQMELLTVTKTNRPYQYRVKDVSQQSVGD